MARKGTRKPSWSKEGQLSGYGPVGFGGEVGAQFLGVLDGCVGLAEGILRALGAGARFEAGGGARKIGALSCPGEMPSGVL
jgi:hypothetical protein